MQKLKYLSLLAGLLLGVQMLCAQDSYILHTVLKGQGLYSIARIYGVTEAEIIALNPGSDKVIRTGEQLKIPQKQINKEAAEETANGYIHHTVQSGETIYRLTITYGVTGEEIYQANPILRTEPLKAGQVVLIPDKKSTVQQVSKSKSDGEEDQKTPRPSKKASR